jgi:hypothetical protein
MTDRRLVLGDELGTLFCQALGLDASEITAMTVRIEPDKPALVEVTRSVYEAEAQEMAEHLTRYNLIPSEI